MPNRNGRAAVLTDGAAKPNIVFYDTTSEGKPLRRAQELRLERAHIPVFTIFWTLMHVLDERSRCMATMRRERLKGTRECS